MTSNDDIGYRLGVWWIFQESKPDDSANEENDEPAKMHGNLHIESLTGFRLEVLANPYTHRESRIETIHGEAHGTEYTLVGCRREWGRIWNAGSVSSLETWRVRDYVERSHLDPNRDRFDVVTFNIQGMQDWSRLSGIDREYTQRGTSMDLEFVYSRIPPKPLQFTHSDLDITLKSVVTSPSKPWSASLEEDSQFEIKSTAPLGMEEWKDSLIVPMRSLIQFATKTGGTVRRVALASEPKEVPRVEGLEDFDYESITPAMLREWLPWSGQWMTEYPYESKSVGFSRPLFLAGDMVNHPGSLSRWFSLFEATKEPMTAYLDLALGAHSLEYRFFTAVRLLERLIGNRSMNTNQLQRVMDRWKLHLPPLTTHHEYILPMARLIMSTRNCFAHQSQKECKAALKGYDLVCLDALVRSLVDCEVCDRLGLPEATVPNAIRDTSQGRRAREFGSYFNGGQ